MRMIMGGNAALVVWFAIALAAGNNVAAEDKRWRPTSTSHGDILILDDSELTPLVQETGEIQPAVQDDGDALQPLPSVDDRFGSGHKWRAWIASETKLGDDDVLADHVAFIPLWQDGDNLLFAYVCGHHTDHDDHLSSWGIGHRTRVSGQTIFGAHVFYDRFWSRTNNEFNQATLGVEWKTYEWDLCANGYISQNKSEQVGRSTVNSALVELRNVESSYYGFDAQVGRLIRAWGDNNRYELRGFVGGFHFDTGHADCPIISGPMARVELRIFDLEWFGNGSRLVLGAEYRWDQVRDDSVAAVIGLRIPLTFHGPQPQHDPFERRFLDRIKRGGFISNVNQRTRQLTPVMMIMMDPPPIPM